jgi:hypothetical protein
MRAAVLITLASLAVNPAIAQRSAPAGIRVQTARSLEVEPAVGTPSVPRRRLDIFARDSAWWVPLASTLLPGLGQIRLGQDRFVAYAAVEAYAVLGWISAERESNRERDRYRALARNISRAFFESPGGDGDWDYYEAMKNYIESGVFTSGGGSDVIPETDLNTYNGIVWLKARELSHWDDPDIEPPRTSEEYQAAIRYYSEHAVRPEFRWSWRNAQLEWDDYRQSIRRTNDASRDAGHYLALVAVNHLLSTVDAFITLRLRGGLGAPKGTYRLTATIPLR